MLPILQCCSFFAIFKSGIHILHECRQQPGAAPIPESLLFWSRHGPKAYMASLLPVVQWQAFSNGNFAVSIV